MKTILCIIMTAAMLLGTGEEKQGGKVESMIREHIEQCEADGLGIPVVEISPKLFGELVGEVGWERVLGSPGNRRWVVFETPDLTRKSRKRYSMVEQYPTPRKPIE